MLSLRIALVAIASGHSVVDCRRPDLHLARRERRADDGGHGADRQISRGPHLQSPRLYRVDPRHQARLERLSRDLRRPHRRLRQGEEPPPRPGSGGGPGRIRVQPAGGVAQGRNGTDAADAVDRRAARRERALRSRAEHPRRHHLPASVARPVPGERGTRAGRLQRRADGRRSLRREGAALPGNARLRSQGQDADQCRHRPGPPTNLLQVGRDRRRPRRRPLLRYPAGVRALHGRRPLAGTERLAPPRCRRVQRVTPAHASADGTGRRRARARRAWGSRCSSRTYTAGASSGRRSQNSSRRDHR